MKTVKTISTCLIVLTFVVPFGACEKEKEGDKKPDCRIGTITEVNQRGKIVTLLAYNSNGKIATIDILEGNNESTSKVFTYTGNTITVNVTRTSGGSITITRDSITVDDKGRPLNIRFFIRSNGTRWTNNRIVYNGDELARTEITTESSSTPQVSTPTYVNGNLVSSTAPWGNSTLEYYTDKELQQGDYLEMTNLLTYGISIGPSKNLVKNLTIGSTNADFNYDMNSQGLISKVTVISGGRATTLTYHYICD